MIQLSTDLRRRQRTLLSLVTLNLLSASAAFGGATLINLGTLPGGNDSIAESMNVDGSVIVGESGKPASTQFHAYRWTAENGMQELNPLGGSFSYAHDTSANGSVVVGYASTSGGQLRAYRWTPTAGGQNLGTLGGFFKVHAP